MGYRPIMSKTVRGRLVQIVENQGALGYRYVLYDGGVDKGQSNDLNYLVRLFKAGLDKFVVKLNSQGIKDSAYYDQAGCFLTPMD